MDDTEAAPVSAVLGWKPTDDGKHVIIGFKQDDHAQFALAFPEATLTEAIASLIGAMGAFPQQKLASGGRLTFETHWYEVAQSEDGEIAVAFHMPDSGSLTFLMDRSMAQGLRDTLDAALGGDASRTPPGISRN